MNTPKRGEIVALGKDNETPIYGTYINSSTNPKIKQVWVDRVGYPHDTGELVDIGDKDVLEVTIWRGKWGEHRIAGPKLAAFPANTQWKIGNEILELDKITIKT